MDIAILGAGNVGLALGTALARAGHRISFGVRNPGASKHAAAQAIGALASNADAVRNAETVLVALPWSAAEAVLGPLGVLLDGKLVIDATNPLAADLSGLAIGDDDSAGERLQRLLPNARVVKAFNTTGAANMASPAYPDGRATMLVAGDDAAAVETVLRLAADVGFEALAAGPLPVARQLEQLALLWIRLAYQAGFGPGIAFRLMRR